LALLGCSAVTSAPTSVAPPTAARVPSALPNAHISQATSGPTQLIATSPAESRLSPLASDAPPTIPATAMPMVSPTGLVATTATTPLYSYPVGIPGRPLGDGFYIRDGYAVENTWYHPGWWHTAEDWYMQEGSSVGARVYAVADGEIVYAGANYPGRVVISQHTDGLFSMYGHLDPSLAVKPGQHVARGDAIGTIGPGWDKAPGHLHFEIRTFFTAREVNGAAPRYAYRCGVNCPPGPGYWPMKAPDHPSTVGWRNPTHVIARRAGISTPAGATGEVVVATQPVSLSVTLWSAPSGGDVAPQSLGELVLQPGERFHLRDVRAGLEDSQETSAQAYRLWYRIELPDGRSGWVQAAVPSARETGSDGRPAGIAFNFFPSVIAGP